MSFSSRSSGLALSSMLLLAAGACSSDTLATPKVYVMARVDPGGHTSAVCPYQTLTPWLSVQNMDGTSVDDGTTISGAGTVAAQCTVHSNGDGSFAVTASVSLSGTNGGSLSISGSFQPGMSSSGVDAVFQRADTGRFEQHDCTADFTNFNGQMGSQGVAAGRIWATVKCPSITNPSQSVGMPPGPETCEGTAEFKFENCGQ